MKNKNGLPLLAAAACVAAIAWALSAGPARLDGEAGRLIFWQIRLPRVVLAGLVGALLSATGGALQALFRNPLADPYLLGVSGGAALGAVAGLAMGLLFPAPMAALGALAALGAVLLLSRVRGAVNVSMAVLSGVAVHAFASSTITLLLSRLAHRQEVSGVFFWLLGSLDTLPYRTLVPLSIAALAGLGALLFHAPALNLLAQGEEAARALGLDVERTKWTLVLLCAALTGLAVTFNGMIAFLGLIIPHLSRLLFGNDLRRSLPLAALLGAAALAAADALGRTLLAPQEIPAGVITALAGAPCFLYVLRRERRRLS